jgi:phage shock protein E
MSSFLSLFRDLTPMLARRNRNNEMAVYRDDRFSTHGEITVGEIREISVRELAKLKESPVIVDVRDEKEFLSGHIEGAWNVSRSGLEQTVSEIVPDRAIPIVVYSAHGTRGALAAETLQKLGYRNVSSLKGGLSAWLDAGGLVAT